MTERSNPAFLRLPARLLPIAALLALIGCGDDVQRMPMPDAGPTDTRSPSLASTDPLAGERGVSPETSFLFQFDEPMNPDEGSVAIEPTGETLAAADGTWFENDTRLQLRPSATLDQGVVYRLTLSGFEDVAGNAVEGDLDLEFETLDEEAPTVIAASPMQDADDVRASIEEIRLTFSESMDTDAGDVDLQGGPRSLGNQEWLEDDTVFVLPVAGLDDLRDYELFAFGFRDRFGNLYDDTVLLDEGVLRFSTGPDIEAPSARSSVPMEGQGGVNPTRRTASITFDEPMDTSVAMAEFFAGADDPAPAELVGRWSSDATRINFQLPELGQEIAYRLSIAGLGYADEVGNALDEEAYLGDGVLDFTTGEDTFPPTIVAAVPNDGDEGVAIDNLDSVSLTFNEPMDTTVLEAEVTIVRGTSDPTTATFVGTWDEAARIFTFAAGQFRQTGDTYSVDVTGFLDLAANPVADDALEDGALGFTAAAGTGEDCQTPLTVAQATLMDGVYTFDLPDDFVTSSDDGAETCDSASAGDDVVIEYVKTTADLASGGNLLRIRTDSDPDDHNIEVATTCNPGDEGYAPLACVSDHEQNELVLDVGPGTYFIFVAEESSFSDFDANTIQIDEPTSYTEGEGCEAPYTTSSAIYTAPGGPDDPHTWVIPEDAVLGYDRGPFSESDAAFSCGDSSEGHDAVIEFDKASDTSVLDVTLTSLDTSNNFSYEVNTLCDPTADGSLVLSCGDGADDFQFNVPGDAGPVYLWLAVDLASGEFPGVRVEIREVETDPGEACNAAKVIARAGTETLTLDSGERFNAGSCFGGTGNVTWYEYTPTAAADFVSFAPNGTGGLVILDAESFVERRCVNAELAHTPALFTDGETLCIGVEGDGTTTALSVTEGTYDGIEGTITDPDYRRAVDDDGDEVSWTSDTWMAVTPTTVYLAETSDVYGIPKGGGERAVQYEDPDGISTSVMGENGWALGERLYSLDDTTSSSSNRMWQLWDGRSAPWDPSEWDTSIGGVYPSDDMNGLGYDGTDFIFVSNDFGEAVFFRLNASRSSTPIAMGTLDDISDAEGLAADDTYVYFIGELDAGDLSGEEGVYRIARADLGNPATVPEVIATASTAPGAIDFSTRAAVFVDDPTDPEYLYFRTTDASVPNAVHVVKDPDGTPLYLGTIVEIGGSADYGMVYDGDLDALFLFETETTSDGRVIRVD